MGLGAPVAAHPRGASAGDVQVGWRERALRREELQATAGNTVPRVGTEMFMQKEVSIGVKNI